MPKRTRTDEPISRDAIVTEWERYRLSHRPYNQSVKIYDLNQGPRTITNISTVEFTRARTYYQLPLTRDIQDELRVFRYMINHINPSTHYTTGWQALCPIQPGKNYKMRNSFKAALYTIMDSVPAAGTEKTVIQHVYDNLQPVHERDFRRLGMLGELAVYALLRMAFPLSDAEFKEREPTFRVTEDNSPTDFMSFAVLDDDTRKVAFLEVCVKSSRKMSSGLSSDNYLYSLWSHMMANRDWVKGMRFRINFLNDNVLDNPDDSNWHNMLSPDFSIYYTLDVDPSVVAKVII